MSIVDFLFDLIARFSILAFLLLGAGTLGLRFLQQPLERIRVIQISLCCVFLAGILCQASWRPVIDLPLLPADEMSQLAEHSDADFGGIPASTAAQTIRAESGVRDLTLNHSADAGETPKPVAINALTPAIKQPPWLQAAKPAILFGFLGVSVLQVAYIAFGYFATWRLIARSKPLSESVESRVRQMISSLSDGSSVRFAASPHVRVPVVIGIIKPTILLPANLANEDAELLTLRQSLAHEWKHIESRDLVSWHLVTLSQVFLWPQPFYWGLRRELRVSQDQIADAFAAQHTGQRAAYAETLVRLSRTRRVVVLGALTMTGTKRNLVRRVEMLLNDNLHVSAFTRRRVIFGFAPAMAIASVVLALLQLSQAAAGGNDPGSANKATERDANGIKQVEAGESVQHSGFVFDAKTDKPIEGATVIVTRTNSSDWSELGITESTTDAAGKYTFTIPPDQLKQRDLYIMFDLRHPEYAPRHCGSYSYAMIRENLEVGSEPWFTKLKMVPGSRISGRVVDERGKPVAGAQLRGESLDPSAGDSSPDDLVGTSSAKAVSNEEGRFEIQVTRDGTAGLLIVPLDHCMKHIDVGSKRGDLGDIVLSPGLSIHGLVLDATGRPLEGLWVNLTPVNAEREASYEEKRSSKSDDRGEFRTRPLSPGKYSVEVETKATGAIEKAKYANFHNAPPPALFLKQVIEVAEGVDTPFVIQAVPHVLVRGRFFNSKGEPRASHQQNLWARMNDEPVFANSTVPGEDGWFEFKVPRGAEDVQVALRTNEHSALRWRMKPDDPLNYGNQITLGTLKHDFTTLEVIRYTAPLLMLKALDENGVQLRDFKPNSKYTTRPNAERDGWFISGALGDIGFESQSDGRWRSSQMLPNEEVAITLEKEGYTCEPQVVTMNEGEEHELVFVLKKAE